MWPWETSHNINHFDISCFKGVKNWQVWIYQHFLYICRCTFLQMPLGLIFLIVIFVDAFFRYDQSVTMAYTLLPDLNPKILYLKLQSVSFASLSPSLFETCNCSYLRNYHLYVGCASARRLGICFEENGWLLVTAPVWILYFGITDSTSWMYNPNKNFHRKMSSEQVTCLPLLFWPTEEKKALQYIVLPMVIKSNDCLAHITSNRAKYYYKNLRTKYIC